LLVLELGMFLFQSDDTGDHLEGGRMPVVTVVDEDGMNLAGHNSGPPCCTVEPCATGLRCRTESATGSWPAHSADIANGPTDSHHHRQFQCA